MENLELLVRELCKYKDELPWLEFKHNNYDPDMIGADISALANGATLDERNYAYFLWGIDDKTHEIVGTEYNLQTLKKGNQELENWLRGSLSPNADFEYQITNIDGRFVGVLNGQANVLALRPAPVIDLVVLLNGQIQGLMRGEGLVQFLDFAHIQLQHHSLPPLS